MPDGSEIFDLKNCQVHRHRLQIAVRYRFHLHFGCLDIAELRHFLSLVFLTAHRLVITRWPSSNSTATELRLPRTRIRQRWPLRSGSRFRHHHT